MLLEKYADVMLITALTITVAILIFLAFFLLFNQHNQNIYITLAFFLLFSEHQESYSPIQWLNIIFYYSINIFTVRYYT